MIEVLQSSFAYPHNFPILSDVNLQVPEGSFIFIVGNPGSGKTTLLNHLALKHPAQQGKTYIYGQDIQAMTPRQVCSYYRSLAHLSQVPVFLDHLNVQENILLPLQCIWGNVMGYERQVEQVLSWLDLSSKALCNIQELSFGEKQKVAIARAMMKNPKIILADEPTAWVDAATAYGFLLVLEEMNKAGATVIVSTHDAKIIQKFPYPVYLIEEQRLRVL